LYVKHYNTGIESSYTYTRGKYKNTKYKKTITMAFYNLELFLKPHSSKCVKYSLRYRIVIQQ